jgi:hypothetical protein
MIRCLTLAVLLILAAPATASANEWRDRQCRYNKGTETWTTLEVRRTIRCAAMKWDVPGGVPKAMSVAECESSYYARAVSDSGTYRGVYQQSIHYWPSRVHTAPDWLDLATSVFNGRSNVIVSILSARGGWGAWAGCA